MSGVHSPMKSPLDSTTAAATGVVVEVPPDAAVRERARADLEPAPVVLVEELHPLRPALALHALVHQIDARSHRVRKALVPRPPDQLLPPPPEQPLARGVHVRHAPVRVVRHEALEQSLEVIDLPDRKSTRL